MLNRWNSARPFRPFYIAQAVAAVFLLANLVQIVFVTDETFGMVFTDIAQPLANVAATFCLFIAARKTFAYSKRLGVAWAFLCVAQFAYTLGDIGWGIFELVLFIEPYPSVVDFLYLAFYPLSFLGLFHISLAQGRMSAGERIKIAFDMGVIIVCSGLIFWNYLVGPLIEADPEASFILRVLSLTYPVGDVVIIIAMSLVLFRSIEHGNTPAIVLLTASYVCMVFSDTLFSLQVLTDTFLSGGMIDLGWIASILLAGLAGAWQYSVPAYQEMERRKIKKHPVFNLDNLSQFMPALWILVAALMLYPASSRSFPMSNASISTVMVIAALMFMGRYLVSRIENYRLLTQLQAALEKAQQKTLDLEYEIRQREQVEHQLLHTASHDSLTGLPNRAALLDLLEKIIGKKEEYSGRSFAILYFDLDNFRLVNDSLGHDIGDQILMMVGWRLSKFLKSNDLLVRLSGDEFIMLCEGEQHGSEAYLATRSIQEDMKHPFNVNGHEIFIFTSIGVVLNIENYQNSLDILRDADIALNQAKATLKAGVEVFKPGLRQLAVQRRAMESDLRRVIEQQELELYYQPILSLVTLEVVGFEALLRWNSPTQGSVSPVDFIPIAEETGAIIEIGQWVLEKACRQLKAWHARYPHRMELSMHINISGRQLEYKPFLQQVASILHETGVNPACIKLEITESVFMEHHSVIQDVYRSLHELGVHLQIDDFGTGYSSLSYLQHIPVNMIKIDRSFVSEMHKQEKAVELIRAMVTMSRSLNCRVIAEGIETREQLIALKDLGCDYGQGYFFSKPVDSRTAENIIKVPPSSQAQVE